MLDAGADRRDCVVAVVDDDIGVLRSIARLLRIRGFDAKTYVSAEMLLNDLDELCPNCIVADLSLPGIDGLQFQQTLVSSGLDFPIVFITGRGDIRSSVQAMRLGAVDFLSKPFSEEELFDAIGRALERNKATLASKERMTRFDQRIASLTRRELEVFAQVVEGLMNKQIAAKLGIAEKTVKIHRARIMKKMEVRSVAQLARIAERFGIPALQ
jgi:FixJ family two-component response regulator